MRNRRGLWQYSARKPEAIGIADLANFIRLDTNTAAVVANLQTNVPARST
jgi:hypothetical protein